MGSLADDIKTTARGLGFARVGIAPARRLPAHQRAFRRFLGEGRHGTMAYLAREPERREDPGKLLPGARSVIALAAGYYQGHHGPSPDHPAGKVARYAWGRDYHGALQERLERLKAFILEHAPGAAIRSAVDHAPLLERAYAQQAGVGFIGKHTLVITAGHGSWVVLAELVTDLELDYDDPAINQCGTCTRCLEACPTGALTGPFELDATRCIAYLTIEHKGETPAELRPGVGEWLFGCDVCQEACPYNQIVSMDRVLPELEREQGSGPWVALDDAAAPRSLSAFERRFAGTALGRAGRKGLSRNAKVVDSNATTVRRRQEAPGCAESSGCKAAAGAPTRACSQPATRRLAE